MPRKFKELFSNLPQDVQDRVNAKIDDGTAKFELTEHKMPKVLVDAMDGKPAPATNNYQDPTPEMLNDPMWNAIWDEIKTWDIAVPGVHNGSPSGATGNHATAIYLAIRNKLTNDQPSSGLKYARPEWERQQDTVK